MNLNKVAREIAKREGGAVNLPPAQIKKVIISFLEELVFEWLDKGPYAIDRLLKRYDEKFQRDSEE